MKGDFSRIRFDKEKHYSEVLMQQGRVSVDADWNEQQAINQHRIETEALDIIGECGAPVNNAGFKITAVGNNLNIGKGRYYVDGILCENDSDITFDRQPDLPGADIQKALGDTTLGLIYLDVWQRHITALDDPLIREVALGGPDTTTRVKTIWQVKILPITGAEEPIDCNRKFSEWDNLIAPSTGTLNARTRPPASTDNPCLLPPSAGYQSLENQLYRIEIHQGGSPGTATFKWSYDNGSIVTVIEKISNLEITVHDIGPDEILGFAGGQWAEILDDDTELHGLPGQIVQIDKVDPSTRIITLKSPVSAHINIARHPKLRRWDSAGEITVPANIDWIPIESGIEVLFSSGSYKTGDYWTIPARTVTGEIEWPPYEIPNTNPIPQPHAGILHHYCRLALLQVEDGTFNLLDCRGIFPPLGEPGIHIIRVLAGDKPLPNDTDVPVDILAAGLVIEFDANIDPLTIRDKPACFVTLDMPFPFNGVDRELWGSPVIGFQPLILAANVLAEGKVVLWVPAPDTKNWLQKLFVNIFEFKRGNRVLAHLTLKGNFIWAQDNPELYLDGEVFGFRKENGNNIDIHLPSGNSRRGGDFEMWFWLIATRNGSISGKKITVGPAGNSSPGARWTIVLTKPDGTTLSTTTDANGNYSFINLPPGIYTVGEILPLSAGPARWVQKEPVPVPPGTHTVTITSAGEDVTGKDFSNELIVG